MTTKNEIKYYFADPVSPNNDNMKHSTLFLLWNSLQPNFGNHLV